MSLSDLRNRIPDYARDLKLNLDSVLGESGSPGLDAKQIRVIALASAIAGRHAPLVAAIEAFAAGYDAVRQHPRNTRAWPG